MNHVSSKMVQNTRPTSHLHHLLQDAGIVIIEIDWSHFPLHFVENTEAFMFDRNAIGKVPPPKVSIRSIPKLWAPKLEFEPTTLQMTETGLFFICDPVCLLPDESTPMGEFRWSHIRTRSELMKNPVV